MTKPQLQRARLAAKKLANSREFRARVWYLAGASLTPDSPRYSPHNNSHACSPVWRVYSPRLGKFPCQNLGRTESKLPQLCLLAKETIRAYWSTLIRRKKNPEEDEFTESEQELISGHDEPQTIQTDFRKCEWDQCVLEVFCSTSKRYLFVKKFNHICSFFME